MFASKVKTAGQAIALPVVVMMAAGVFVSPALGAEWVGGEWTECSAPCGGGVQTRDVGCVDETGRVVDDDACAGVPRPADRQECNTEPCPDPCGSDTDCSADLYCAKAPGDCHGEGVCRERPLGCPRIFKPVCGCDGLTYSNDCIAASNGVNVAYEGECNGVCGGIAGIGCPDGEFCQTNVGECCCDFQGVCTPLPPACTDEFAPVCGCDGNIYGNACEAAAAGVSIDNDGACFPPRCETDQDCEALRGWCAKPPGQCDGPGMCSNGSGGCFLEPTPVCGCDGITYNGPCATLHARVNIAHEGACEQVCGGIAGIGCPDGEFCQTNVGECCCDFQGVCTPLPPACTDEFAPVCGCDGNTYDNACKAAAAAVSIDHEGECSTTECRSNADCDDGAFCDRPIGHCDGPGLCRDKPAACPAIFDPVRGCNGVTYNNACEAAAAGVSVASELCGGIAGLLCDEGEYCQLPTGHCRFQDAGGDCTAIPAGCPDHVDPVCGCDGVTYGNPCEAAMAGVSILYEGECTPECNTNDDCPGRTVCKKPVGECDAVGVCELPPDGCGGIFLPVCGCDGYTYDACQAAFAGVDIAHQGECADTCTSDADCEADAYCRFRDGICSSFGVCEPRPEDCTDEWAPVCGCDGNTYGNACEAAAAGVSVAREGACEQVCGGIAGIGCPEGEFCQTNVGECCCDFQGVCTPLPPACTKEFAPVCGCDGVTYGNACEAAAAGVSIDYEGPCLPDECEFNEQCSAGMYCAKESGDCNGVGHCVEQPPGDCLLVFDPVCGCDGETYGNTCFARAAGVNVAHEGVCEHVCGTILGLPCEDGEYCRFPDGRCEVADDAGVCEPVPTDCPDVFDPVCGCDGTTYGNACEAAATRMQIAHQGACEQVCGGIAGIGCPEGEFCQTNVGECCCDFQGVCTPLSDACPKILDPVCGCDGVTYDNECLARARGVSIDHEGACITGCVTHDQCADGGYCRKDAGDCDGVGACEDRPRFCTREFAPVCGCDGNTYSNACNAAAAGVSISHEGQCVTECVRGTPCDDGDPCTFEDQCIEGECIGTPASRGDLDCDGDVDLSDYLILQAAYTGAGGHATIPRVDLDGDGDSDLADILVFQVEFTGPR